MHGDSRSGTDKLNKIRVISSDKDGADLRREKTKRTRYLRCSGKSDDGQINDVIDSLKHPMGYFFDAEAWQRIFGG